MCYATKTSEVCAIIKAYIKAKMELSEIIKLIQEDYDISEEYITEKYNSFSSNQ